MDSAEMLLAKLGQTDLRMLTRLGTPTVNQDILFFAVLRASIANLLTSRPIDAAWSMRGAHSSAAQAKWGRTPWL